MSSNSLPFPSDQSSQVQAAFSWKVQQFQTPQTFSEKFRATPTWSTATSTPPSRASQEPVQRASSSKPQTDDTQRAASTKPKFAPSNGVGRTKKRRKLNEEEEEISRRTAAAIALSLEADHILALYPDVDTPFNDEIDVIDRLLPYHVFQHPKHDLDSLRGVKGKAKMTEEDLLREELRETNFAIECHKRLKSLEERMRRTRIRAGVRPSPSGQAIALERMALEADQAITSEMDQELSSARSELDKLLRAQRIAKVNASKQAATTQQPTSSSFYAASGNTFTSTLSTNFSQYYSSYTYPYGQSYIPGSFNTITPRSYSNPTTSAPGTSQTTQSGTSSQPVVSSSSATTSQANTTSNAPTSSSTPARVSIPLTMPVTSLPALQALGILPVPKAALPPPNEPQPAAVLLGSTNNGSMLSLEINAARLQPPQMSGLAVLLTTLVQMSGGTSHNQSAGRSVFRIGAQASSVQTTAPNAQIGGNTASSTDAAVSSDTYGDAQNQ